MYGSFPALRFLPIPIGTLSFIGGCGPATHCRQAANWLVACHLAQGKIRQRLAFIDPRASAARASFMRARLRVTSAG